MTQTNTAGMPGEAGPATEIDLDAVKRELFTRARGLGFDRLGVASIDLHEDEQHLLRWLAAGYHGSMGYMQRHGLMRSRPQELAIGLLMQRAIIPSSNARGLSARYR